MSIKGYFFEGFETMMSRLTEIYLIPMRVGASSASHQHFPMGVSD